MKKIINKMKYYKLRLKMMDTTGLKSAVKYASEKSGRSQLRIFLDMLFSSFKYMSGYTDYNEYEFYKLNARERKTYLTLGQSHKVTKYCNDAELMKKFDDKSVFNKLFKQFVSRDSLDLRESNPQGLKAFVEKHSKVMAKRTNDYVGRGIDKIDINETPDIDFDQLYKDLMENRQYLIEEFFKQHQRMNELSSKSVNTIRMITFVDRDKVPHLIVAALKSGLGSHVDNFGQGGMYTILDENGKVKVPFIDKYGNHHTIHPLTQMDLLSFVVPNYDVVVSQVLEACLVIPEVRFIGWDVAISEEGNAEIIEGNTQTGPFQVIPSFSTEHRGIRPDIEQYLDWKF